MVRKPFFIMLFILITSTSAFAADISVKPDRNTVAHNETFRLVFTVKGKQDGEPDFSPLSKDFQLLGTSTSSQFNMINGRVSQSKQYILTVAANQTGKLVIPSIQFGKDQSPASEVTITAATSAPPHVQQIDPSATPATTDNMFVEVSVDNERPYVQQQVIMTVKVFRDTQWADANLSDPVIDGGEALIQHIGDNRTYKTMRNGNRYTVTEIHYAVFPQASGKLTIMPFNLTAKYPSGKKQSRKPFGNAFSDPIFDDFFSRQTYVNRFTKSTPIELDVKAIPQSFKGKTWLPARSLKLQETWSANINSLTAGEPVTRTVAIIADGLNAGQLPEIKLHSTDAIKVYPDQPVINDVAANQGFLSTRSRKFALIPSQEGKQEIPSIEIPWWNTETDQQEVARLPMTTLQITGAIAGVPQTPGIQPKAEPITRSNQDLAQQQPQTSPTPLQGEDTSTFMPWLIAGNIILLLLLLITLFAWLKVKKQPPVVIQSPEADTGKETSTKQEIKTLQDACSKKDAAATRDALIKWAATIWPDHPPNNLNDVAKRLNPEPAAEILKLNQNLYANDQTAWDADLIAVQVAKYTEAQLTNKIDSEVLEPLYL